MLINIARSSLHEFLGDRVIYRNLKRQTPPYPDL